MNDLSEDSQKYLDQMKNIILNYKKIYEEGDLEKQLINVYPLSSCFKDIKFEDLKMVFDACNKEKLFSLGTIPQRDPNCNLNPFTVFRGCVGKRFRPGMSWTTELCQAIKYPKRAKSFNWYGDDADQPCSVWCALVKKEEIYCYLNHSEPEFIVCPKDYWKVDIPQRFFEQNC